MKSIASSTIKTMNNDSTRNNKSKSKKIIKMNAIPIAQNVAQVR